jgi:hypothetical protein
VHLWLHGSVEANQAYINMLINEGANFIAGDFNIDVALLDIPSHWSYHGYRDACLFDTNVLAFNEVKELPAYAEYISDHDFLVYSFIVV